jgi:hypothetical protein
MTSLNWKSVLIGIAAIIVGKIAGMNLVVPAITGLLTYWAIDKFGNDNAKKYQATVAFITGHTAWMVTGFLAVSFLKIPKDVDFLIFDIAIGVAFALLLIMNPKKWVFILIFLFEIVSLVINFAEVPNVNDQEVVALLTHIVIRVGIVVTLLIAIYSNTSQGSISLPSEKLSTAPVIIEAFDSPVEKVVKVNPTQQADKKPVNSSSSEGAHLVMVILGLIVIIGGLFVYLAY